MYALRQNCRRQNSSTDSASSIWKIHISSYFISIVALTKYVMHFPSWIMKTKLHCTRRIWYSVRSKNFSSLLIIDCIVVGHSVWFLLSSTCWIGSSVRGQSAKSYCFEVWLFYLLKGFRMFELLRSNCRHVHRYCWFPWISASFSCHGFRSDYLDIDYMYYNSSCHGCDRSVEAFTLIVDFIDFLHRFHATASVLVVSMVVVRGIRCTSWSYDPQMSLMKPMMFGCNHVCSITCISINFWCKCSYKIVLNSQWVRYRTRQLNKLGALKLHVCRTRSFRETGREGVGKVGKFVGAL